MRLFLYGNITTRTSEKIDLITIDYVTEMANFLLKFRLKRKLFRNFHDKISLGLIKINFSLFLLS